MRLGYTKRFDPRRKRQTKSPFVLKGKELLQHMRIVGKTGVGKSTLLERVFLEHVYSGAGATFIDPHGHSAEALIDLIPPLRQNDVIYFNASDRERPIGFNPLANVPEEHRSAVVSNIINAIRHLFPNSWGPQLDEILLYSLHAMLDAPNATFLTLKIFLTDVDYRKRIVSHSRNSVVRHYWNKEFPLKYQTRKDQTEVCRSTLNKLSPFVTDTLMRNILCQPNPTLGFEDVLAKNRLLIINLADASIGEENAHFLGSLLVPKITLAAKLSTPALPHHVIIDEFSLFGSTIFAHLLSTIRKFNISLTLAHQYNEQISPTVLPSLHGNVGTTVCFRIGALDTDKLSKELNIPHETLTSIEPFTAFVRTPSVQPQLIHMYPPAYPSHRTGNEIIRNSRNSFGSSREILEKRIDDFLSSLTS